MRRCLSRSIPEGLGLLRCTASSGSTISSSTSAPFILGFDDSKPRQGKHAWSTHVCGTTATSPLSPSTRGFSSSAAAASSVGGGISAFDALAMVFSPSQLGAQLWEAGHALTGLPWWASIPITTLAVRAALAPLSVKASSASVNWLLLDSAFAQARVLSTALAPEDARALGRMRLVRAISSTLRARHGTASWRWFNANTLVQGTLFVSLTKALSMMSDALWPGLTDQGTLYFNDLTAPPLYPAHLSTPYGTLGAIMPLIIVLIYMRGLDASLPARAPGIGTAARVMVLPIYGMALVQPHAVLLYWLSFVASHSLLTAVVPQSPAATTLLAAADAKPAEGAEGAGKVQYGAGGLVQGRDITTDVDLLTGVGHTFLAKGKAQAAEVCFRQAIKAPADVMEPEHMGAALAGLGSALIKRGQQEEAVEALLRAGRTPGASAELRARVLVQAAQLTHTQAAARSSEASEGSQAGRKSEEALQEAAGAVSEVQDEAARAKFEAQLAALKPASASE